MLKIKIRNSRNRRNNLSFLLAIFWEVKIKLHIMTACMLSALRKQHVCNLKKNCNSNIFTRNCWKAKHRSSWILLQIYQTGRKNFCLGSNLVDKNWTSKLKLSSRAFAVAIIFQVYVRWKINVVKFNVWINWIHFLNPFLA